MSNPLVSVIIPSYNHEAYIVECLNSIIEQTYQNIELIVVDDGSKDNTWSTIQSMKEKCEARFVRTHFETKENEGTCKTLNKLIALSRGEYIYLIASDDKAKPQAIEQEIAFLKDNPEYVLAVGDNEFIDGASQRIGWDRDLCSAELSQADYKTFGDALQHLHRDIDFNSAMFGSYETFVTRNYVPNGYLIRKTALDQAGPFTPDAPLEDWWMHLQLSKIGKYKYIDEVLFSYRWHDNNTAKRRDYMRTIACQTQYYEMCLVESLKDKTWQQIFERKICKVRMKLNFMNVIKWYTLTKLNRKDRILEIFGHKFILKTKMLSLLSE